MRDMPWERCYQGDYYGGGGGAAFARGFSPFGGTNVCTEEYRELLKRVA
eukprot:CAMPEP_0198339148 /NCGR_PEP_ID=MMETSP1450-20131203/37987_1 /TAXON_ID=753684 ORGANISM="Madagascaria erythrocladiodes, Strain CCMP3234" /NCGR_SAMPLE_ID=MMETSP1450 /ASSEMBLY_ACC=CAM_ASM_001115 /LENGTH=48 /DNA_ID= /DNA_START= /DNA_END= /DNA_ORIENTATION=